MSIEVTPTKDISSTVSQQEHPRWLVLLRSPLWLCLLLALIVRVWLVVHTGGYFQSDEAFVGIQAQHILQGERPIYYYGQPYMGSLEAYLIAIVFAIAGSSGWTLRVEPIVLSLVLVWLTWKLAAALATAAHLPLYAQRRFMFIAALCAALPPLYDAVTELRTLGGYIETFVLMLVLLLSALRLTQRWHLGASSRELALRWAGIGFIVGLGLWVDGLIISAVLAAALWIVGYFVVELVKLRQHSTTEPPHPTLSLFKKLLLVFTAIPASLIGLAPALYWGASSDQWVLPASRSAGLPAYLYYWGPRQWANITFLLRYGSGTLTSDLPIDRLPLIRAVVYSYRTCIAPRVIGGGVPEATVAATHPRLFLLGLGIGLVCILGTSIAVGLSFFWPHPLLVRIRQLASLPLLFGGCTAFIFCISKVAAGGLPFVCSTTDAVGRYGTPLALALPFLLATLFTVISMSLQAKGPRPSQERASYGRDESRPLVLSRPRFPRVMQTALFALLLVYLGVQGYTYVRMNARYAIEVIYCHNMPADNAPIIAYMQQQHIHYAWASSVLAIPIVFETNGSILVADPHPDAPAALDRLPLQTAAVIHADRPSVLTLVPHDDPYPQLLRTLDGEQVTYRVARFPASPGFDLLVVTPLNRTISPSESNALSLSAELC